MEALKSLKKTRASHKSKLTIFKNYLEPLLPCNRLNSIQSHELNARLSKIQQLYDQFDANQIEIENLSEIPGDEELERKSFESLYFSAVASAEELLGRASAAAVERSTSAEQDFNSVSGSGDVVRTGGRIKLPMIGIPTFSGDYHSWLEFRETFMSLIHNNKNISDIEKFHYLKASVKANAKEVIYSIGFSAENYKVAWDLLCDRYNNDRMLVSEHVQALFNIEPIQRESSVALHELKDVINKNLRSLKILGIPTEHWDLLVIHLASGKLDHITARDWEHHRNLIKGIPTLNDFNSYLKDRSNLLETIERKRGMRRHSDNITHTLKPKTLVTYQTSQKQCCPLCKSPHTIYQCSRFKVLPVEQRIEKIKQLKLCTNCLRGGHDEQLCRFGTCKLCSQRHNTLLHLENQMPRAASLSQSGCVALPVQDRTESPITLSATQTHTSQVLLSTAIIHIADHNGHLHKARALLDNGSTSSFITEKLHKLLNIPSQMTSISVQGINNQVSNITQRCDVTISSLSGSGYTAEVNCFIVPQITQFIPSNKVEVNRFLIPSGVHLADPEFDVPAEVQVLLGADVFWHILQRERISLGRNRPILIETRLGYLVSGTVNAKHKSHNSNYIQHALSVQHSYNTSQNTCHTQDTYKLHDSYNTHSASHIQGDCNAYEACNIHDANNIHHTSTTVDNDYRECETIFKETTTRQADGRFVVTIPLRDSPAALGETRQLALARFQALERKFKRYPKFKDSYVEFMEEYLKLGHMAENIDPNSTQFSYLIPHHGILREDRLTTKLRTVFDASAVTPGTGKSFNEIQYVGPTIQDDLVSILIRFRQHKLVVTADIKQAYRQVLVTPEQRHLQQIFWRSDPSQEIKQYFLNTVSYGTASAPYLTFRCLAQLGKECTDKLISTAILSDFYADDFVSGHDHGPTLIHICKGVMRELEKGQFQLRKWHSNDSEKLREIVGENTTDSLVNLSKHEHTKTLGLQWACKEDTLSFSSSNVDTNKSQLNKRTILSTIAQVFDPLGLINPVMLQAKLILQKLWAHNISWDSEVPRDIRAQWDSVIKNLTDLTNIQIPRRVLSDYYVSVELHTFADASVLSYSACCYIRSVSNTGKVEVHLLMAKTKLSPLRQKLTMPRLELCGALLATRLANKAKNALRLNINSLHFWCDSTIVLCWLKTCKKERLKQFVYNRINEISKNSEPSSWNYVPSGLNPADIGSRGLNASQLKNSTLWWAGPHFLHNVEIDMPKQPLNSHTENIPETKFQCHVSAVEPQENDFTSRYSSFNKLQRITALINRFIHNCKNPNCKLTGPLKISELNLATHTLCKIVQTEMFCKQYSLLVNNQPLSSKDKYLSLNPFMHDGIIRVGGRLSNSNYDYNTKYPMLLHASHNVTKLLVEYYHKILLHAGPQLLLAILRHKFWIINGRKLVRKITKNCYKCCRFSGVTYKPIMGNLPAQRLHADFPFSNTAVDYAGPIVIVDRKGRGSRLKKSYICVFVCLAVRAIHIELVTDLSSQSFLSALNRFIARRGRPTSIWSDNGTNFRGACNELAKFLKFNSDAITSYSEEKGIDFKFCPAYSPHFNGIAERAIGSIKRMLNKVLTLAHLDYEEMNSVLIEIEGILNSRPLTPLSNDPSDLVPLTPAHFLIGRTITMLPATQAELDSAPISSLTRYQRTQALKTHFWNRYRREYISELQLRNKWKQNPSQPTPGDMVLIKDDRIPPNRWLLGRVTTVYKGGDGVSRVADVLTSSGTIRRAFNKLCPLPMLEQHVPRGAAC